MHPAISGSLNTGSVVNNSVAAILNNSTTNAGQASVGASGTYQSNYGGSLLASHGGILTNKSHNINNGNENAGPLGKTVGSLVPPNVAPLANKTSSHINNQGNLML